MYKLAVFDVDGTLLNSRSQISQGNVEAIKEVMDSGVKVILATGKHFLSVLWLIDLLGLKEPQVTCNGAIIYCPKTKSVMESISLKQEVYEGIIENLKDEKLPTVVYTSRGIYTTSTPKQMEDIINLGESSIEYIEDYFTLSNVAKILYIVPQGDNCELDTRIRNMASEDVSVVRTHHLFLEFVAPAGNKSIAIKQLADRYGIKNFEIIAFGDSENDVDMLKTAGLGVCMANGSDPAKESSDVIVSNNDADGVREGLEKYILSK